MTLESQFQLHCPHCNKEQTVQYYQSVNITLEPELKSKILSGKLNTPICSNCKQEINIVSGLLYHDMKLKIMLELSPEGQVSNQGQVKVVENLVNQGYIYRKVQDYRRLIEKISIFDHKLNDIVVQDISERMKAILEESRKSIQDEEAIDFTVIFNKIEQGLFKKEMAFHCFNHENKLIKTKYNLKWLSLEEKDHLYNMNMLRKK